MTRTDELENYFNRFPDVPREVIIKEDLLRMGVGFSDAAVEAAKNSPVVRGTLFTELREKADRLKGIKVPDEIHLISGPYGLKRTVVANRINSTSPYLVDVVDSRLMLTEDGREIAAVEYPPLPRYYGKKFEDGTLYEEVIPLRCNNLLAFNNLFRICQLWGEKEECKFCDINWNAREREKHGIKWTRDKAFKSVEQVAEVAEEIFIRDGYLPGPRPHAIFLTGGTILGTLAEKTEDEFYLSYIDAIRERIGYRTPILLQSGAKDKETCKIYRDAGLTVHGANIEVWDKDLFKILCPGKEKYIGRDEWIKRVVESVDVFGEGNVCPNFVMGVELCKPYGFKDINCALKSMEEGLEFLMSHGVCARFDTWNVSPYTALAENEPPPLEYLIRADLLWCETWVKYDLPPVGGTGSVGPGRGKNQISAIHDMDPSRCVRGTYV